ncbi:hypothetical protein N1031_11725 [Herbiconiux moechotypicola]|uniref:Uncharacterized protein n=1 Tax=Herbiconiux moechotypicola TaxID=637393 RepID=A0ABN3DQP2_9MICO|nr:hypothetical protein [Herbiconiux moechotypicola]MCS5730430.1 hypothetical protein [Herbiconiux moechotypicola]
MSRGVPEKRTAQKVAATGVLAVVHGVLLWVVLPLAFVSWFVVVPFIVRRSRSLPQYLGWVDVNVIAALQRIIPAAGTKRIAFVSLRDISTVAHRAELPWDVDLW